MTRHGQQGRGGSSAELDTLVGELAEAFSEKESLNLLMLSGGGSLGAWGAGVLNGWTNAPNGPKRPQFDVVTGVSTGAVQATAAFLGTPEADQLLKEGYTETTNSDVYGPPWILLPHNLNALRDTLKERFVTDAVIAEVAKHAGERKLFVGAVDLASSQLWSWDLTKLAEQGECDLYREVILASSANPIGIWPIEVDSDQCVDGGVRVQMFAETIVKAAGIAARKAGVSGDKTAYYIVNGKLRVEPKSVWSWNWPGILMRSLEVMMNESMYGSLYAAWYHLNGTDVQWTFRGSHIPQAQPTGSVDEYDPEEMKPLYTAGYDWGTANVWHEGLPAPEYGQRMP